MMDTKGKITKLRLFIRISMVVFLYTLSCKTIAHSKPEAKDIVAIQVRAQGLPCTKALNAKKDIANSFRDEMSWVITCKEAIYRVRLIPHTGAKIKIIDDLEIIPDAR